MPWYKRRLDELGDRVPHSVTRIEIEDRVPRSGTKIEIEDQVPRSGTKIVYEDRSVTFRHQDRIWIGCHVPVPG